MKSAPPELGRRRPYVIANFAMTWDARISTRSKTPSDFSSPRDKARLLEVRALGDAIMVGRNTLAIDNMAMGMPNPDLREKRAARKQAAYPIRVIVSNSGALDPGLKVFQKSFSPILIYTTERMPAKIRKTLATKATIHAFRGAVVDIPEMLEHLHSEYAVRTVVCEGGPMLFRSLAVDSCVDELYLTICPYLFGGKSAPTITGVPGEFMPESTECRLREMQVVDGECFLRYRVGRKRQKRSK